ncbi:MAG: cytochrome c [Acidobacteriia bacterium]|nr:cytochrome c [Terriglobia bacterium]
MRHIALSKSNFLLPVMALLACGAALAQSPTYKVGRPANEAELRLADEIVGSDGKELPPGSGTAKEGAPIFAAKCAVCHGPKGEGGIYPYPRLVGGRGTLTTPTPIISSESYMPFATTLWDFINRSMPPWPLEQNPAASGKRALTPDNVYALSAYILYMGNIIKETDVMDRNSLPKIEMPNRHGFYPDPPQTTPDQDCQNCIKGRGWLPYWDQVPAPKPAAAK